MPQEYLAHDFAEPLRKFFQSIGYKENARLQDIIIRNHMLPVWGRVELKEFINAQMPFELSFQEEMYDETNNPACFGRTVFGLESCKNPEYVNFYFQRKLGARLDGHLIALESSKYLDSEAEDHLDGVISYCDQLNEEQKIPKISGVELQLLPGNKIKLQNPLLNLLRSNQNKIVIAPSELMQKRFLSEWIEKRGKDADVIIISIGSDNNSEQQNPAFAAQAREVGKKVEVLNIDGNFPQSFCGEDGISFLGAHFGKESQQAYDFLKQFLTEKSDIGEKLVVLASYTYPFSSLKFFDEILESNSGKKNMVTVQGYCDYSCAAILSEEFFSVMSGVGTNSSLYNNWHILLDSRYNERSEIPEELLSCVKIFPTLADIKIADLLPALEHGKPSGRPSESDGSQLSTNNLMISK
jgi:hypothetical protein